MNLETMILTSLHALAAVIWVGGIFFAYRILRPAALSLEPRDRLILWEKVFRRFFGWVWFFILVLVVSGYWDWLTRFGSIEQVPLYLQLMEWVGWLMIALFIWLFFWPFAKFKIRVAQYEFAEAGHIMNTRMRPVIAINLMLGVIEVVVGASGPFWPMITF